ncbi:T9SS type A sorting domain-containing protein, partial [bacterium]|nr:T9SS type A sorting domain-containing protein [bacterium]
ATWGDFDGDGDLDLYATDMRVTSYTSAPNSLFLNIGEGTFVDIAPDVGVDDGGSSRSTAWVDFDCDGDLDLYLASNGRNRLWRNDGGDPRYPQDWIFTDIAPADSTGIGDGQYTMGATWSDYDNDSDPDLFLNNYYGGLNRLFRNDGEDPLNPGEWLFVDVAPEFGLDISDDGLGVEFGDYNNDGLLDILLGSNGVNHLFKAVGDGFGGVVDYLDVSIESGIDVCDEHYTTGVTFADYDNDGFLDILFGNHWQSGVDYAPNNLLHNDGQDPENPGMWTFSDVSPLDGYGIADGASTNGVAWADYDNDGDLDVYFATMTGGENKLFRNDIADSSGNNWLHVDLYQPGSYNLRGVGSKVRVVTSEGQQIRFTNTGSGFLTQHSLTSEFGLGTASSIDTLEVTWPNGTVQASTGLSVNQKLTIYYSENQVAVDGVPSKTELGNNYPNPFNPMTTINFKLPARQHVKVSIYAIDGSLVRTLVDGVMEEGAHRVQFNGRDDRGAFIASGAYLYRMQTADKTSVRRMMLVR